jgi:uncharacterized protein (TIGR02271 family)
MSQNRPEALHQPGHPESRAAVHGLTMAREPTISKQDDEIVLPLLDEIVLPLLVEEIAVAKERVVTGRVRVSTMTREREELVDELLAREDVQIERRPVGKLVDRAPAVRQTGDTIIIPVVEEVLTVVRRLVVREEIRIRLINNKERRKERVTVRRQEAIIDRIPAATRGPPADGHHAQTQSTNKHRPAKKAGGG